LPPERIASNGYVKQTERRLIRQFGDRTGYHDKPHARSPKRHSLVNALLEKRCQIEALKQLNDRGRLTARYDEGVNVIEVRARLNRDGLRTNFAQRCEMFTDVALQRKNAGGNRVNPLHLITAWCEQLFGRQLANVQPFHRGTGERLRCRNDHRRIFVMRCRINDRFCKGAWIA